MKVSHVLADGNFALLCKELKVQECDAKGDAIITNCTDIKKILMKQFEVPNIYRSSLISAIKNRRKLEDKLKKDFTPTLLDLGGLYAEMYYNQQKHEKNVAP